MSDPLSPASLLVPEVRKAIAYLWHDEDTDGVEALLLAVRDATLKAERDRLLALTPEQVVEAARLSIGQAPQCADSDEGGHDYFRCPDCARTALRAALPVLLAPEVAKREQVERERDGAREDQVTLCESFNAQLAAAEAEATRLRKALGKFGNAPCVGTDENNDTCGVTFTCGACRQNAEVRAALEGTNG